MSLIPMPPAELNEPPTKSARPPPSSKLARHRTRPVMPLPRADQEVPSHRAIPDTGTPPAWLIKPPA
jgi:hypothetical protein